MRLSTRLLVLLLPTVVGVMLLYAFWALDQREGVIRSEARREVTAYARTLALALDEALAPGGEQRVREVINRLSLEPTVYGVLVYDARGRRLFASDSVASALSPDAEHLAEVLSQGSTVALERELGRVPAISVLTPVRTASGRTVGALEVAQPLSRLETELARVRTRYVLNTLTLVAVVGILTIWLVRVLIGRPMEGLVRAARAVGSGQLGYRIGFSGRGELADLSMEFDKMAANLEAAHAAAERAAEERVGLERRLRESEKLATIGTLGAGLAHEIAAPLNVIRGRAEMLLRKHPAGQDHDRNLRIIREEIDRVIVVVRNLLTFARRKELSMGPVRVRQVLDTAWARLQAEAASGGVALEIAPEIDSLVVLADRELLQHVFDNLLMNAVQAARTPGRGGRVEVRGRQLNGRVWVDVCDSGPGVRSEDTGRLFEPLFTTKVGGTGLGLALSRNLVEEQGGSLEFVGPAGDAGAVFRLELRGAGAGDA